MDGSKRYHLNKKDGAKILKGAGIAGGGAVIGYLIIILTDIDFGSQTPIIVAVAGIFLNAALKFFKDSEE